MRTKCTCFVDSRNTYFHTFVSMASYSSSSFLFSLLCFFFFFFEKNTFAFAIREDISEVFRSHGLQQTHHLLHLSSLLPSSSCTPAKERKGKLEVVHKHGPCSKVKQHKSSSSPSNVHTEILTLDKGRVESIQRRVSYTKGVSLNQDDTGFDQALLQAKSGSLLGSGNYFVTVGVGSPARELSLVFDTGSDLTWTQCEPCARSCYSQKDPIFDPSKSSSYSNVTCSSSVCTQLSSATGNQPGCSSTKACIYGIQYGDSSFSVGYFAKEKLTVTSSEIIDNFLFGCGQNNQGLFNGIAGLLGLGRHPISFVQQTAAKYHKIFSYCLPSTASSVGYLNFGGSTASGNVKYTPFSSVSGSNSFYGLEVAGLTLAGSPISSSAFSSGTIIDSGTVISRIPPSVYTPLRDGFRKLMAKYTTAPAVSILDTCYDLSGYKTILIPKISLSFKGGVTVQLDASGILYVVSVNQVCLAFAANSDDSDVSIIGNVQQKTLQVVYDVEGGKVGFGPGGCH